MQRMRLWWPLSVLVATRALAQGADGGEPIVPPKSANPGGADAPAELVRASGLSDGGDAFAAAEAAFEADAGPPSPVYSQVVLGPADGGSVLIDEGVTGRIGASARLSYQRASTFPGDDLGTGMSSNPFETRLRINPEVHYKGFGFVAEADTATGAIVGQVPDSLVAARVSHPLFSALELRQLYAEFKWKTGVFRAGQQLSQWGLGILANGGNKDPEAGDFGQQHFGSLTYRAMIAGRPFFGMGGAFRAIEPVIAADLVVRDGTASFADGDRAVQGVFALRFAADADHNLGVYAVYRHQRAVGVTDGARATDVFVIDLAGKWSWTRGDYRAFNLGFEVAGITGTTTQARNDVAPVAQVRQWGAAIKSSYRRGKMQLYLDWGYASGDQNPGDDRIENFRFDRDYKVGLILFDEVLAYQSARSSFRAADPKLLGQPPDGVDLAPTGGGLTSAWYLFPRLRYGVMEWLDLYGGPLFAFTTARLTDPFNSKLGGGTAINYLGGVGGSYLGTELDIGAQARWRPIPELLLSGTLEAGLLLPGDAFNMGVGGVMGPVGLARLRLAASL